MPDERSEAAKLEALKSDLERYASNNGFVYERALMELRELSLIVSEPTEPPEHDEHDEGDRAEPVTPPSHGGGKDG